MRYEDAISQCQMCPANYFWYCHYEKRILELMLETASKAVRPIVKDFLTNDFTRPQNSYVLSMADYAAEWASVWGKHAVTAFIKHWVRQVKLLEEVHSQTCEAIINSRLDDKVTLGQTVSFTPTKWVFSLPEYHKGEVEVVKGEGVTLVTGYTPKGTLFRLEY